MPACLHATGGRACAVVPRYTEPSYTPCHRYQSLHTARTTLPHQSLHSARVNMCIGGSSWHAPFGARHFGIRPYILCHTSMLRRCVRGGVKQSLIIKYFSFICMSTHAYVAPTLAKTPASSEVWPVACAYMQHSALPPWPSLHLRTRMLQLYSCCFSAAGPTVRPLSHPKSVIKNQGKRQMCCRCSKSLDRGNLRGGGGGQTGMASLPRLS